MKERKSISESILELYELGELPDEEMAIVREAIDKDEGLRMRHKTIQDYINEVINNDSWEDIPFFTSEKKIPDIKSSVEIVFKLFRDYLNKIGEIIDGTINFQPWSPILVSVVTRNVFSEGEDDTDITVVKCIVDKNQADNIYEFELNNETMVEINIPHEYDNDEYSLCIWSIEGDTKKQYRIKTKPGKNMLTIITEPLKAGKYFAAIIRGK